MMTRVEARCIRTASGTLDLVPASNETLLRVARYWPMGALLEGSGLKGVFGLTFQIGEREMWGVKLQPAEADAESAALTHQLSRVAIACALPRYLKWGHRGVMVPCAYLRTRESGLVEAGFAFFVGPDADSASKRRRRRGDRAYDQELGVGAGRMIGDMAYAITKAGWDLGLPLGPFIDVDVRPRLAIGALAMHFLVEGPRVVVVKSPLDEGEPVWVRAGFSRLEYAPMVPASMTEEEAEDVLGWGREGVH
jgi:hypothetical protein